MKSKKWFKQVAAFLVTISMCLSLIGCSTEKKPQSTAAADPLPKELSLEEIEKLAKEEGKVVSVGMPDDWANWKDTWTDLKTIYGLEHSDTDMSSAEEIAKFEAEKEKPTADIGDVGMAFAPVAVQKGVTQPYKTSYWKDIPDWAKDREGHWMLGYQGTIAFITNKKLIQSPPKTWDELLNGEYKVAVGDVAKAAQAQNALLAAAMAKGGDESNIDAAYEFFSEIAKQRRLSLVNPTPANFENGEVEMAILWDFNALSYRDLLNREDYEVTIPADGSIVSGYATIINKYAPHPHAAMLAREYILSDAGQINLAKGYARPIRDNVNLPEDVKEKMLPLDQYKNVKPIKDFTVWENTAKEIPQKWQEKVLIHVK